jgi:hypothetical protein
MRATGLMLSSQATTFARRSVKTATPQGAKDQVALQGAMRVSLAEAQDQSAISRFAQPDREVRLGWRETTKESLFRLLGTCRDLQGSKESQSRLTRVPRGVNRKTPGAIFSILPSIP